MKVYPLNDTTLEKFQKVTIRRKGDEVIDIFIGSMSVVATYFKEDHIDESAIKITTFDGTFDNQKCKIFAIKDNLITDAENTLLVSSYSGMLVQYGAFSNPFVTGAEKLTDTVVLAIREEKKKLIDFSGKNINKNWAVYQITSDKGKNVTILHYPYKHSVEIVNIKKGKLIGEFQEAVYSSDMKHVKIRNNNDLYNIIDFDGNTKFEWSNDIDDHSITSMEWGKTLKTFFYLVHNEESVLYNEDFEKVMNLDKEGVVLKISSSAMSNHLVLTRNGGRRGYNILDENLKPMFEPWLDKIIYNYFSSTPYLFLCHSPKGYVIMNGESIKPIEGIPEYIESINRLDDLTAGYKRYGLKIKSNECKILTYKPDSLNPAKYEFNSMNIRNILTDGKRTYIDTKQGMFAVFSIKNPKWTKQNAEKKDSLELVKCNAAIDTYFSGEYVIVTNGKFNIIKENSEGMSSYFTGGGVDNMYDIQNRFIIVERGGKFAYFDTTRFDLFSRDGIIWWNDVEPAEETDEGWIFRVKDDQGNWIDKRG